MVNANIVQADDLAYGGKRLVTIKEHTTGKRKVIVGFEQYVNKETGELENILTIHRKGTDINFHKVWVENLFLALGIYAGVKMKIFLVLLRNAKDNIVNMTQDEIATEAESSQKTVAFAMKELSELKIVTKIRNAKYYVNPEMIYNGSTSSRMKVLHDYDQERYEKMLQELESREKHS